MCIGSAERIKSGILRPIKLYPLPHRRGASSFPVTRQKSPFYYTRKEASPCYRIKNKRPRYILDARGWKRFEIVVNLHVGIIDHSNVPIWSLKNFGIEYSRAKIVAFFCFFGRFYNEILYLNNVILRSSRILRIRKKFQNVCLILFNYNYNFCYYYFHRVWLSIVTVKLHRF